MERSVRLVSAVFLVLMLLVTTETGNMVSEAKTCESHSHQFKGKCEKKSHCAAVCKTEGFTDGHCRGIHHRCFCSKHC
ncbi:defensin-like protein [Diospyros lotus]|uniref:defensin-like protein n=1 Tax=Diospyros lotus TaxID=55363 RepID=UPI002251F6C3|nr:defensin-like protein [Diospyros lotus]